MKSPYPVAYFHISRGGENGMMSFDDEIPKRNTKAIALPLMSSLPLANLAVPMWQQPARQSGKFSHPFSMSPPLMSMPDHSVDLQNEKPIFLSFCKS